MARDLRFIVSAIKVSSDLERVGDHAVNIAQSALRLIALRSNITPDPEIEDMARRARADAQRRARCLHPRRRRARPRGLQRDDEVDALHDSVFRILLTHMMDDPTTITPSLELLLVSRNLERVADLATNIAEDAVYLAEGKQIKHGWRIGDLSPQRPDATPAALGPHRRDRHRLELDARRSSPTFRRRRDQRRRRDEGGAATRRRDSTQRACSATRRCSAPSRRSGAWRRSPASSAPSASKPSRRAPCATRRTRGSS